MNKLLPVGKVSKLFGLDGGVLANLYNTFTDRTNIEEPLFVKIDGLAVPLFMEYFERRGKSGALIRFDDIDTPDRASEFLGHELFIRQENEGLWFGRGDGVHAAYAAADGTEDDGGVFLDELEGYSATVSEPDGETLKGRIIAFIEDELNPLLQLEIDGKEVFIPAADEFIDEIDTIERHVSFIVPQGLLALYL